MATKSKIHTHNVRSVRPKYSKKRQRDELPPSQVPSQHRDTNNVPNPLMAVYAVALMDQERQSYVRSAGRAGVDIYEEAVAQGLAGTHMESTSCIDEGNDTLQHVPFHVEGNIYDVTFGDDDVLVITPSQMAMFNDADIGMFITNIRLCGFENVLHIWDCFLSGCSPLKSIDLSPLRNVTHIDNDFMYDCSSITTIDMSPLASVTTIACSFMGSCTSLTTIDINPLVNLEDIGGFFLCFCSSLSELYLPPRKSCMKIGIKLFYRCDSLPKSGIVKEWIQTAERDDDNSTTSEESETSSTWIGQFGCSTDSESGSWFDTPSDGYSSTDDSGDSTSTD